MRRTQDACTVHRINMHLSSQMLTTSDPGCCDNTWNSRECFILLSRCNIKCSENWKCKKASCEMFKCSSAVFNRDFSSSAPLFTNMAISLLTYFMFAPISQTLDAPCSLSLACILGIFLSLKFGCNKITTSSQSNNSFHALCWHRLTNL